MGRTKNALRNITTSIAGQLLNNVLRFVCRTVFIYTLGKQYLGISSLYSNILTIFSVSELGFSSAITYSLYRPLAEGNTEEICSLMQFFKKAYRIIGIVIFAQGIIVMPFLPYLMTGATDVVNIYVYYLLYLSQTVISYLFFSYKGTLLIADQKRYLSDMITYIVQIGMNVIQIISLVLVKSFFVYTVISIICTLVQNLIVAIVTDKKYPYLKEKAVALSPEKKHEVFSQVYAMSLYRISTIVGTATDNLIISAYISVVMVGLYDNYYMIMQVIQKLVSGFFQAFTSSLGNYYVLEDKGKNEFMFRCLNLLNSWIVVFCSVCFAVLFQPFIELWIGKDYLLSYTVVLVIVANFATNYLNSVVQIYKDATGLFVRGKYRAVATAVLNLAISILLVQKIGLAGVFLGSIISRMVTTWWYDAWLLYRVGFEKSPKAYYLNCAVVLGITAFIIYLIEKLCKLCRASGLLDFVVRFILCVLISNITLLLIYGRSDEWKYLFHRVKNFLRHQ